MICVAVRLRAQKCFKTAQSSNQKGIQQTEGGLTVWKKPFLLIVINTTVNLNTA